MIIPPNLPPVPPAQAAATTPQQNAAAASAAMAAQKTAKPVATQTARAPAPVAKGEASRNNQSATFRGRNSDREAEAVEAVTDRGRKLDLSV